MTWMGPELWALVGPRMPGQPALHCKIAISSPLDPVVPLCQSGRPCMQCQRMLHHGAKQALSANCVCHRLEE